MRAGHRSAAFQPPTHRGRAIFSHPPRGFGFETLRADQIDVTPTVAESKFKIADLARPTFKANPYPFYARLRATRPVCPTKLLGQPTWLVTRYDDVFIVLKDERF